MTLFYPIWLLLLIPLIASMRVWRLPSRLLIGLRFTAVLLIVLALAGLSLKIPSRAGVAVVAVDRSLSMPASSEAQQLEAIALIQEAQKQDSRLAVVAFGQKSAIEQGPTTSKFGSFMHEVKGDASNMHDALETALSLIPANAPGRIIMLSDGRWTGKDPTEAAVQAAARGIPIDYRAIRRSAANDAAIERINAPQSARPGESFMIAGWVRAPVSTEIKYRLMRGGETLSSGTRSIPSGLSRLLFRDTAHQPGVQSYILEIDGGGDDPVPENNRAKLLVGVEGERPILHLANDADSGLGEFLRRGQLNVQTRTPRQMRWSLDELGGYSALLIENAPANRIGTRGMENIANWVKEAGAGIMMTGGKTSYGPGGYFKSPLEPIMPVSMELRQEHRKMAVAIAIAMDRSGSMGMPVAGGRMKMDLANLAAAEVYDMLSLTDEFGAIAVDSQAHVIADLDFVDHENSDARDRVIQISPGGGGIFVYNGLDAAVRMLQGATAQTRHVILLADAADSEQPGAYVELIRLSREAGITFSVVGLGNDTDPDAEFLKDIAKRGDGRIFFTNNAEDLPRLFAQDTIDVARSSFIEDPVSVNTTGELLTLVGKKHEIPYTIGGYNLCYVRPEANLATVSVDEYDAPIIAAWQAGLGRALAYTAEASGKHTGEIAKWDDYGNLLAGMARWTAGDRQNLPDGMVLTQEVENGVQRIDLHLDPEREGAGVFDPPTVSVLRGVPGRPPVAEKVVMEWTSADTITAHVPLRGSETVISTVDLGKDGSASFAPVSLPYSPEYLPEREGAGLQALQQASLITGGKARVNLADVWRDLDRLPRYVPLAAWLLCAAAALLLLEVLERRTGIIAARPPRRKKEKAEKRLRQPRRRRRQTPEETEEPIEAPIEEPAPPPPIEEPRRQPAYSALRQAQRRARNRIGD